MAEPRSGTAMAMWSISVSSGLVWADSSVWVTWSSSPGLRAVIPMVSFLLGAVSAEEGDAVLAHLLTQLGVVDPEALGGGEAQHTDLALVEVLVHLVGGLARLLQAVHRREDGLDLALADE